MKTKLENPNPISRRAKARAGAAERALGRAMLAGALSHLRKESERINQLIEREFEQIEPDKGA